MPATYLKQLTQYTTDAMYIGALFATYALAALIDLTPWE